MNRAQITSSRNVWQGHPGDTTTLLPPLPVNLYQLPRETQSTYIPTGKQFQQLHEQRILRHQRLTSMRSWGSTNIEFYRTTGRVRWRRWPDSRWRTTATALRKG